MKSIIIYLAIYLISFSYTIAQTNWYKYPDNPVLVCGPSGSWDDKEVTPDYVIYDNGTYHMWYDGAKIGGYRNCGLATSPDGINWTKHPNNPVLTVGPAGRWDDVRIKIGSIITTDSIYHLWYAGNDGTIIGPSVWLYLIGYASSSDGGVSWTKHPQPVLTPGTSGEWDASSLYIPSVIFESDTFKMWYSGGSTSLNKSAIGYAWSLDGISWTKYNDPNTTNPPYVESDPVVMPGEDWEAQWCYYPCVMYNNGQFEMWYTGISNSDIKAIGYAVSSDGINWAKDSNNPIMEVGLPGSWDFGEVFSPKVILVNDTYKMWFGGWNGSYVHTGYAVDVTNIAHSLSMDISLTYIPPQGDTLNISSVISIPESHQVEVYAIITGPSFSDSIELSNNGLLNNGILSNNNYSAKKWLSGLQEDFFNVELKTNDLTSGMIHIYPFPSGFTTAGPIEIESMVVDRLNDGRMALKNFSLTNKGLSMTVENIGAELTTLDTSVEFTSNYKVFGDIPAGENKMIPAAYAFYAADEAELIEFKLKINSNGIEYWTDSFIIDVKNLTGIENEIQSLTKEFSLEQNCPNPFNPATTIEFSIPKNSFVTLKVFDISGREVDVLVNEEKNAGNYKVQFNSTGLTTGIYFYRLKADKFIQTKKMVLMK